MMGISWMPSWVEEGWTKTVQVSAVDDPLRRLPDQVPRWECRTPFPSGWEPLTQGLVEAGERLRALPIRRIVDAIGSAIEVFRDRNSAERVSAIEAGHAATGLSCESLHRCIDVELINFRALDLWTTLERELGDPLVLDEFRSDKHLSGFTRAFGPKLVAAIATGNILGLVVNPICRSLLVKAPVLLKVARGEPTFASRFAEMLHRVDPVLGDAVVVTYWESNDDVAFDGALRRADAAIVYGSTAAVESVQRRLRPGQRVVVHGHKFSAGIVTQAHIKRYGLEHVAERLALDVCTFDQHACIAPKVVIVEGDHASVDALGSALAVEMARYGETYPSGARSAYDAASLAARRVTAGWDEAKNVGRVWEGANLAFTVVRSAELPSVDCGGDRYIVLVPAESPGACAERLAEHSAYLQNVVVGASGDELVVIAERLAQLGACRVSPPGTAANPTMIWRHDGRACIFDLLRWCDIEGLEVLPDNDRPRIPPRSP